MIWYPGQRTSHDSCGERPAAANLKAPGTAYLTQPCKPTMTRSLFSSESKSADSEVAQCQRMASQSDGEPESKPALGTRTELGKPKIARQAGIGVMTL